MKIRLLGTGTSQGVPVMGCDCEVCLSSNLKDKRLRTSALIIDGQTTICIDTGPDFRQQLLLANTKRLDAILLTHEHNDHIIGIDDIRPFVFRQNMDMPVYGLKRVLDDLKQRFAYTFSESPYAGVPRIRTHEILPFDSFEVSNLPIQSLDVLHGNLNILGYLIHDFCYITDASYLQNETIEKIKGVKFLVINSLHHEKHHTHFNLKSALEMIEIIQPQTAVLTHISHHMGLYDEVSKSLPSNVILGYDGLEINL